MGVLPGLLLCGLQHCCGRLSGRGQPPHRGHHHLGQPGRSRHRHLLADPERPVRHERRVVGLPRRRGHYAGPDGVPAQAPTVCVQLSTFAEKSRVLPRLLNILNIQCLLPLAFRRAEGPHCLTGQGPPLCGGLAGFFFEHPAQVVGPGKAAHSPEKMPVFWFVARAIRKNLMKKSLFVLSNMIITGMSWIMFLFMVPTHISLLDQEFSK